jgi:LCP family protein required for cell wall assembly
MSVVTIDAETGKADIIGLPRDLEDVPFPEGSPLNAVYPDGYGYDGVCDVDVCQLNSIYTEVELKSPEMYPNAEAEGSEPGIEAMRDAASGITGLTIQYYVLIDMQGFSQLIDALGGVDINVAERLPIGGDEDFNNVDGWVEAGQQHMDGFTALWYGRARHGTSDYDRMARQRVLQEAILKQFNPANVLTKFQGVAQAGQEVVNTDVPQGMLGYFTNLATKTKELPVGAVELVPDNGVDPTDPDYDYIAQLIDAALNPVTETPAP